MIFTIILFLKIFNNNINIVPNQANYVVLYIFLNLT